MEYSGSILINEQSKRSNGKHITSKSSFFEGYVIIRIEEDKVVFRKPEMDYRGKQYKTTLDKNGYYHTYVVCELPVGKFEFDEEESDEDCRVVYYR